MKYQELAEVYEKLAATSKRLDKTYHVAQLLKAAPEETLPDITLLAQGRIFPHFDQTEIGVASKLVVKALALGTGSSAPAIESLWAKSGDLGLVAEQLAKKKFQRSLTVRELTVKKVVTNLRKLATLQGARSVEQKLQLIAELLTMATPLEAKYIVRTTLGELRIGVGDGSVRDAIAWAFFPPIVFSKCPSCGITVPIQEKCVSCGKTLSKTELGEDARKEYNQLSEDIQRAFDMTNDFGKVALLAKTGGRKALETIGFEPGNPIKVMLAQKVSSVEEGLECVGTPAEAEYKYDGFRLQVHKRLGKITLFTRRLENVSIQFPDVIDAVKASIKGEEYIFEGEAVGFDPVTGKYQPFQSISQRIRRKYGIEDLQKRLPVELNVFDCIYYEGKSLISAPFKERRAIIEKFVEPIKRRLCIADHIVTGKVTEIDSFYKRSLAAGNEGIMLKALDAPYKPGSRVGFMVKLKPVMDTLDLVIVGAEWGEGKRAKWLTSFTLACIDNDEFKEIGKVGTGIKELESEGLSFAELTEMIRPLISSSKGREVVVRPKLIVEVKFEEIQRSPTYSSGFALRFPRLVRIRDDRAPDDAATLNQIQKSFKGQ